MKFDLFISYSHEEDRTFAPLLEKSMTRFGCPWYRRSKISCFRDTTTLAATPYLWAGIEEALVSSRFFLLLASPAAARSKWVQREVSYWLKHKGSETLLILISEGNVVWDEMKKDFDWHQTDAVPHELSGHIVTEPLFVDFRRIKKESLSMRHPDYSRGVASIVSAVGGVPMHELIGDHVRHARNTRRQIIIAALAFVFLTGLACLGLYLRAIALGQLQLETSIRETQQKTYNNQLKTKNNALETALSEKQKSLGRSIYDQAVIRSSQRRYEEAAALFLQALKYFPDGSPLSKATQRQLQFLMQHYGSVAVFPKMVRSVAASKSHLFVSTKDEFYTLKHSGPIENPTKFQGLLYDLGPREPDSALVYSESHIAIYDPNLPVKSLKKIARLDSKPRTARFSLLGYCVCQTDNNTLQAFDTKTGKLTTTRTFQGESIKFVETLEPIEYLWVGTDKNLYVINPVILSDRAEPFAHKQDEPIYCCSAFDRYCVIYSKTGSGQVIHYSEDFKLVNSVLLEAIGEGEHVTVVDVLGNLLSMATKKGKIRFSNLPSGKTIHNIDIGEPITAIDVSPKQLVAMGTVQRNLKIYDLAREMFIHEISTPHEPIHLQFTPDGTSLVSGFGLGFNRGPGPPIPNQNFQQEIYQYGWDTVRIWNLKDAPSSLVKTGIKRPYLKVDDNQFLVASERKVVGHLRDTRGNLLFPRFLCHSKNNRVRRASFTNRFCVIDTGFPLSVEGSLSVWPIENPFSFTAEEFDKDDPTHLDLLFKEIKKNELVDNVVCWECETETNAVKVLLNNGEIKRFDLANGKESSLGNINISDFRAASFSADNQFLAVAHGDVLELYRFSSVGQIEHVYKTQANDIDKLCLSKAGEIVAAYCQSDQPKHIQLYTDAHSCSTLPVERVPITHSISARGRRVFVGDLGGIGTLYSSDGAKSDFSEMRLFQHDGHHVLSHKFTENETILITGTLAPGLFASVPPRYYGRLEFWDTLTGAPLRQFITDQITSLDYNEKQKTVYAATYEGDIFTVQLPQISDSREDWTRIVQRRTRTLGDTDNGVIRYLSYEEWCQAVNTTK